MKWFTIVKNIKWFAIIKNYCNRLVRLRRNTAETSIQINYYTYYRDSQGVVYLVNVTSEKAAYIQQRPHKTTELLEIWQKGHAVTVVMLLNHLERLAAYDLCDDLREAIKRRELLVNRQDQIALNNDNNNQQKVFSAMTYDDRPGYEQQYDAFVLYAEEDRHFVNELFARMDAAGFKLCVADKLLEGHMTPYAPMAQLITERCKRLILICSPAFLSSHANTFCRDYVQAVGIDLICHKIIPIMYRDCLLSSHFAFSHKLYYNEDEERPIYDFWLKLKQSLERARATPTPQSTNRLNCSTKATSLPQIKVELLSSNVFADHIKDNLLLLSPPKIISMNDLDSLNCDSLSSINQKNVSSDKKKKRKILRRFMQYSKISKPKEVAH